MPAPRAGGQGRRRRRAADPQPDGRGRRRRRGRHAAPAGRLRPGPARQLAGHPRAGPLASLRAQRLHEVARRAGRHPAAADPALRPRAGGHPAPPCPARAQPPRRFPLYFARLVAALGATTPEERADLLTRLRAREPTGTPRVHYKCG
ncbi:hypothetical protein BGLA2_2440004 [Burkholderia gladioli]|nr:hypothetical protein BGLA2_2440004 [Burkholderia gladioli]